MPKSGLQLAGALKLQVTGPSWKISSTPPWHCTLIPQPGQLLAIPADASGGMRGGDRFNLELTVVNGASLIWQPPSASLFYPSSAGTASDQACEVCTNIRVAAGSSLVFLARPAIPCRDASIIQRTLIELETGANLYFQELWTAGRIAAAEHFAFTFIDSEFELRMDGQALYRESWNIGNSSGFPLGPAGMAGFDSWGLAIGVGQPGKLILERETQSLAVRGFQCINGALDDLSTLSRFSMSGVVDQAYRRFSSISN